MGDVIHVQFKGLIHVLVDKMALCDQTLDLVAGVDGINIFKHQRATCTECVKLRVRDFPMRQDRVVWDGVTNPDRDGDSPEEFSWPGVVDSVQQGRYLVVKLNNREQPYELFTWDDWVRGTLRPDKG